MGAKDVQPLFHRKKSDIDEHDCLSLCLGVNFVSRSQWLPGTNDILHRHIAALTSRRDHLTDTFSLRLSMIQEKFISLDQRVHHLQIFICISIPRIFFHLYIPPNLRTKRPFQLSKK